jgi:hypothetical protein
VQEQKWHEEIREAVMAKLERQGKKEVKGSHLDNPKIELYRQEKNSANRLSDVDIAVFNLQDQTISEIVEVESAINPKKFVGIVLTTHLCYKCSHSYYPNDLFDLREKTVSLLIVYKAPSEDSKKAEKLEVMKDALKLVIEKTPGSLKDFDWVEATQYLGQKS